MTGEHAPYTHNLSFLAGKSNAELTKKIETGLAELGKFNIEARYPDYTMSLYKAANATYTASYLKMTKELLQWLRSQLEK